ncbi:hypothetical protein H4696_009211 [Amycolatopsis lexingtonensis]|uniref:DUF222 domain-containing protein n=3 Tax=Amycolatopsis lexingtonensis TaxID=218822 RepID=A0ABR9IG18_9PSEU|nr:DUF6187 family protein [Amycolatopsis lexingtonensis]MBE1502111.1 hypothetical protein [Amycolatopsis lexingtonensis]
MDAREDTRFALPEVDAPAATEVGVILLGLEADRLLAGLGLARLADDPALVTQVVDQARHGVPDAGLPGLLETGRQQWRSLRAALGAPPSTSTPGSLRREWDRASARVAAAVPGAGAASLAYLTACVLRRADVDRIADRKDTDVVLEVPAG